MKTSDVEPIFFIQRQRMNFNIDGIPSKRRDDYMKKRKKQSLSLIVALLPLLLLGILYLTPVYAGPETLGPSPVDQLRGLGTARPPAEYVDDTADDDADSSETTGDAILPVVTGQVSSLDKKATPLRSASGFDVFNAGYGNQWKASFSEKTGKVKVLYGALSKSYENGPETIARGFLGDSSAIFGLKQDLSDLRTLRVDKTPERDHVRFQQTYNNVPIAGVFVLVHSNPQGQVTMVQNSYIQGFQVANAQVVAAEAAKNTAIGDLEANLKGATLSNAKVEQVITPHKEKYYYVWKIAIPTRNPWGYWVYHVDAATGQILYKSNEIRSLKNGKGRAYKSNADWLIGKISNVPLKTMFTTGDGWGYTGGYLWGLNADIWDYDDGTSIWKTIYSPTYSFLYDPIYQKDSFDATHAYYQMDTAWWWWYKNVIVKYGPSDPGYFFYAPPAMTIVNEVGLCNAFYSSPYYFVFGDQNSCAAGSEDLVIDSDVVHHEYTHAMMDWAGFDAQFGGPVNYYGRAMGEGNADWFAYLWHPKDPYMAEVAWYWSAAGYLRNLDWVQMYPYNVGLPDYPAPGQIMPEEHYTGQIWGAYLHDLYRVLKKGALKYVYNSFYYFDPAGGWMSSYPDFWDAIWAQVNSEYDLTGKYTSSLKAWGSMTGRGINGLLRSVYCHNPYFGTGANGCDSNAYFGYVFPYFKSITTSGNLLVTGDPHDYVFSSDVSGLLTATVTGKSGGIINPTISLYTSGGVLLASGITTSTKAALAYYLPAGSFYTVRVSGIATAPTMGYYTFKLSVK